MGEEEEEEDSSSFNNSLTDFCSRGFKLLTRSVLTAKQILFHCLQSFMFIFQLWDPSMIAAQNSLLVLHKNNQISNTLIKV